MKRIADRLKGLRRGIPGSNARIARLVAARTVAKLRIIVAGSSGRKRPLCMFCMHDRNGWRDDYVARLGEREPRGGE